MVTEAKKVTQLRIKAQLAYSEQGLVAFMVIPTEFNQVPATCQGFVWATAYDLKNILWVGILKAHSWPDNARELEN